MKAEDGHADLTYNWGTLMFVLSLDKSFLISDSYAFYLYNDQLMLLGDAKTGEPSVVRGSRSIKVEFDEEHIWLPGHYFLLMRCGGGSILRFDLMLNNHREFKVDEPIRCPKLSDEDILSGWLCRKTEKWRSLSQYGGLRQWKEWLINRGRYCELNNYRSKFEVAPMMFCNNFLLSFQDPQAYTGAVALFKNVADIEGSISVANCSDFRDATHMNPYERLEFFFSGAVNYLNPLFNGEGEPNRVYCFYQLGILGENSGKVIAGKIRAHWPREKTAAIFCDTKAVINNMLEMNPSWQEFFPEENRLSDEHHTFEEMIHTIFKMAHQQHLYLDPQAADKMCKLVKQAYFEGYICQWGRQELLDYVKEQLKHDYCEQAVNDIKAGYHEGLYLEVKPEAIDKNRLFKQNNAYADALEALNAMVGLDDIKQSITTLSNRMRFYANRRQFGLPTTDGTTYHAIFTGNPGTGKTTVARMLGKIYQALGLLSKGDVICVDRSKMIGRYIGETEENMKLILQEARGNVLFVDEAYTLYSRDDDKDFGRHALECLLVVLAQKDPDMLVIFAGYKNEMDKLMSMNPGLISRFPYKYHFSDYDAEQLMQIAETILAKDQYQLTEEAKGMLNDSICDAVAQRNDHFANARWVEQFVRNGIIPALADRVSNTLQPLDKTIYQRIEAIDVSVAYEKFNPRVIELRPHRKVGFSA